MTHLTEWAVMAPAIIREKRLVIKITKNKELIIQNHKIEKHI